MLNFTSGFVNFVLSILSTESTFPIGAFVSMSAMKKTLASQVLTLLAMIMLTYILQNLHNRKVERVDNPVNPILAQQWVSAANFSTLYYISMISSGNEKLDFDQCWSKQVGRSDTFCDCIISSFKNTFFMLALQFCSL